METLLNLLIFYHLLCLSDALNVALHAQVDPFGDDKVVGSNMHKLFDGPVRKVYNPYIEKIPQRIREKYGHIRF